MKISRDLFALGLPGGRSVAPTQAHCVWLASPRGGLFALGLPGGEQHTYRHE